MLPMHVQETTYILKGFQQKIKQLNHLLDSNIRIIIAVFKLTRFTLLTNSKRLSIPQRFKLYKSVRMYFFRLDRQCFQSWLEQWRLKTTEQLTDPERIISHGWAGDKTLTFPLITCSLWAGEICRHAPRRAAMSSALWFYASAELCGVSVRPGRHGPGPEQCRASVRDAVPALIWCGARASPRTPQPDLTCTITLRPVHPRGILQRRTCVQEIYLIQLNWSAALPSMQPLDVGRGGGGQNLSVL